MKKFRIGFVFIALMMLLLSGCGVGNFEISGSSSKTTIKVNNAEDDAYGETYAIEVGKNRTVVINSELDKGELKIDFAEAVNFAMSDEPDDWQTFDVVKSVSVGPGDSEEFTVPEGYYILQLTTIGQTNGKVIVNVNKN